MKLFDDTTVQVKSVRTDRQKTKTICPNCRVLCNKDANFCGRCGLDLKGGTAALRVVLTMPTTLPYTELPASGSKPLSFMVLLSICLLAVLVAIGTSAFAFSRATQTSSPKQTQVVRAPLKPVGRVWFYSDRSQDDSVALQMSSLPKLAHGNVYVLWLINPLRPNQLLSLGPLVSDSHNGVSYRSGHLSGLGATVQSLRSLFTRFAVTIEPAGHKWLRPSSAPLLRGSVSATI